ncbi:hypothetical protein, partial [Flavobacterium sp.]|uniref:hypothetical protein n=1 Tax=Flavobacterium sp. TaxID=239 RepID=UPI00286E39EE
MESWKRHKKDKTKGVKAITGIKEIKVGDWENYDVSQWHEGTPQEKRNEAHVKWELYHLKDGKTPVLV